MRILIASLLVVTANGFGAPNPAFVPYHGDVHPAPQAADDFVRDDFDAPTDRLKDAGHIIREAKSKLDHEIVVDDECYMGKDGSAEDCVDFDPVVAHTLPDLSDTYM